MAVVEKNGHKEMQMPSCLTCKSRFQCGIGNANACREYEKDLGASFPCLTCERRPICTTFNACMNCGKKQEMRSINMKKNAPTLKIYAKRLDEFLPIEAEWATVDEYAIRLFLGEPVWNGKRWVATDTSTEIMTVSWEGAMLDGIVDLDEFKQCNEPNSPVIWHLCKVSV